MHEVNRHLTTKLKVDELRKNVRKGSTQYFNMSVIERAARLSKWASLWTLMEGKASHSDLKSAMDASIESAIVGTASYRTMQVQINSLQVQASNLRQVLTAALNDNKE